MMPRLQYFQEQKEQPKEGRKRVLLSLFQEEQFNLPYCLVDSLRQAKKCSMLKQYTSLCCNICSYEM